MSRSLIVLPEDSSQALVDGIAKAAHSIRIKMFVFSDPNLLKAVAAARARGVRVRVILNAKRRSGKDENSESRTFLQTAGIEIMDGNPAFDVTHEKSMVVDDAVAYIMSLNWQTKNLTETRDYAVITHHRHEVHEVMECFDSDWTRGSFTPGDHSHLIWCVGNGRQRLGKLIDEAKHSIWLQNERYQDQTIIEHLVRASRRGVRLHIMAPVLHKLKKEKLVEGVSGLRILADVGAKVHKLHHVKLHAKMLLTDDTTAIVGSINLAPGSFDSRRELAVEVKDKHVVDRLLDVVRRDWENSRKLELSDEGLMSELAEYDESVMEDLAISTNSSKRDIS